jgi:CheY-like chemotaxis protein
MTATHAALVVDDDKDLRDMLAEALTDEGFDVRTAAHGEQALALLAQWRPHVILLDLNMSVMDGWTFRRVQLGCPSIADIPVIVFSASYGPRARDAELKVTAFLPKTCDIDKLTSTVRRACLT